MSTKIYNAVRVPISNIRSLVALAREIEKMELTEIVQEEVSRFEPFFGEKTRELSALYSVSPDVAAQETRSQMKRTAISKAMRRFFAVGKDNPFRVIGHDSIELFARNVHRDAPSLSAYEASLLVTLMEQMLVCRTLSFFEGRDGMTLLKWYTLTEKTEKWLRSNYQDAEYQNQTDGPCLEEQNPDLAQGLNAVERNLEEKLKKTAAGLKTDFVLDVAQRELEKVLPLPDNQTSQNHSLVQLLSRSFDSLRNECEPRATKVVQTKQELSSLVDEIRNKIAYVLYEERGIEWDEAFNGVFVPNKSSLSYTISPASVCYPETALCENILHAIASNQKANDSVQKNIETDLADFYEKEIAGYWNAEKTDDKT